MTVIFVISYPSQAIAETQAPNPFQRVINRVWSFISPPKELGTPVGRGRGAGGRGRCSAIATSPNNEFEINQLSLIALIPPLKNQTQVELPGPFQPVWGKTLEEYPSFWFYIPFIYKESEAEYGKFVMLDKDKRNVAEPILFKLPNYDDIDGKPIIAKLTLPRDEKPLKVNKQYNWFFSIICDERKPSRNPSVTGWIEREAKGVLTPEGYMYYARSGIVYDAVNHLIESRRTASQSQIEQDWLTLVQSLSSSMKLKKELTNQIVNAPIVELNPVRETKVLYQ